ncbi:MAG: ABC transporter ATP-binding protein, partial [Thermostichales cyanobacterium GMQP_bins_62]
MTAAVTTEGLSKIYRTGFWLNKQIRSLNRCSLQVNAGETFGLLGPNGAGKTTTIKCLLGIITPSEGSGTILGKPLGDRAIKQQVGYLPENAYFYDQLTAWEFLELAGSLFQIPGKILQERIPKLLEQVGLSLETARKKALRTYSKGMLQRTGVAQALINDPTLIFLDEPMSGLDPLGRHHMRQLILDLKKQGKTIFFNTHILSDVEAICDRVAILVKGNLVASGSLEELLGRSDVYQVKGQGGAVSQLGSRLSN